MRASLLLAAVLACAAPRAPQRSAQSTASADDLVAADRALGSSSASSSMLDALGTAFADDVTMPDGPRGFAEGRASVLAAIGRDTLAATSRVRWAPVRAGVSGDGSHGFTMGFMEVQRADGTRVPQRYLAYWVRDAAGWRMRVLRRSPRPAGAVDLAFAGALSAPTSTVSLGAEALATRRAELAATERAFSDSSQTIGLGEAFAFFGHEAAWLSAARPVRTSCAGAMPWCDRSPPACRRAPVRTFGVPTARSSRPAATSA